MSDINQRPGSQPLSILAATSCAHDFACLSNDNWCDTDLFNDRDVQVIRCKESRRCLYRRKYADLQICTCPVKTARSLGII